MRKPDETVRSHTARVALGVSALVVLMLMVYAIIGRLTPAVALGAVYAGALGVANFFVMGLMVQSITDRAAERQRTEQEIAELSAQMRNRMKLSYNLRMIALFLLLALGIAVLKFDPVSTIIATLFPTIVVRIMQILEARRASGSKGSEAP